jgi:hypothetical protein
MRNVMTLFVLLFTFTAAAQTLVIGPTFPETPNTGHDPGATLIDLSAPAPRSGTIDRVSFAPTAENCRVRIRFFHISGDTVTVTAERGPFDAYPLDDPTNPNYRRTVTLNPPVEITAGEFIGITPEGDCGPTASYCAAGANAHLLVVRNYNGAPFSRASAEEIAGCKLALRGTGTADEAPSEVLKGVLPAIGSAPGNFGSFFRTSLQLAHPGEPGTAPLRGRLLFHRAGAAGSPADPSLTFTLQPNQVLTFDDILPAMGLAGLGSMDIIGFEDDPAPVITARVYNDAGANGTSGAGLPVIDGEVGVVSPDRPGYLITPVDVFQTRFNIGVRTLAPAAITFTLYGGGGTPVAVATRTYPANYFEQFGAEAIFGPLFNSQLIRVTSTGPAIVYGSVTDNRTNDPAINLATVPLPRR